MVSQAYSVGFLMDATRVVLIRKNRPAWQAGLYNGVGGHIEPGETPLQAMAREFREETGLTVVPEYWNYFLRLVGNDSSIWFYRARVPSADLNKVQTMTDEEVRIVPLDEVHLLNVIPNLRWILPFATYTEGSCEPAVIWFKDLS
jgi:8-oxo-dGTP diphosphatase